MTDTARSFDQALGAVIPLLYRFAVSLTGNGVDAEELTQESILRAWKSRDRLRTLNSLKSWLFQIAVNLHRDQLRTKQNLSVGQSEELDEVGVEDSSNVEWEEHVNSAMKVLSSLPAMQRSTLHLYAVEEMSLLEIAEVLGIKTDTAKVHLSLARKAMRQRMPQLWVDLQASAKKTVNKVAGE